MSNSYFAQYPGVIADRELPEGNVDWKNFKAANVDIMRLHLELVMEEHSEEEKAERLRVLRSYGDVCYGESISRDIIVPADMPLYALHYVIQKAFGWQNSHLHSFTVPEERLLNLTWDTMAGWLDMVGLVLRSPLMGEEERFWADDYDEDMDFNYWLRKLYTGPYQSLCHGEGYLQCEEDMEKLTDMLSDYATVTYTTFKDFGETVATGLDWPRRGDKKEKHKTSKTKEFTDKHGNISWTETILAEEIPLRALRRVFDTDIYELLERLPLEQVLAVGDHQLIDEDHPMAATEEILDDYDDFMNYMDMTDDLSEITEDLPWLQPSVPSFTDELLYEYDFGDSWKIRITGSWGAADLVKAGRLTQEELDAAILKLYKTYRPVIIAQDGCNLVDDMGGAHGLIEFLRAIHPAQEKAYWAAQEEAWQEMPDNGVFDTKAGSLEWARSLGWSRRKPVL